MYRKTRVLVDWIAVLTAYSLVLLIIPLSNILFGYLGAETVDAGLNLVINLLIAAVFFCLLVYLIKRGKKSSFASYLWLAVFFIISIYFLAQVQVTRDRLHFLGYGILSLLLYRALRHNIGTKMLYFWSSIFIMFFATFDEGLQAFGWGGRAFELKDIGIDWLSSLLSQFLIALVVNPKLEAVEIKIVKHVRDLKEMRAFIVTRVLTGLQRFNLDRLAAQVCLAFKNITGYNFGHVHFIYKGKKEHLVLVCDNQKVEKIVVKDRHCKTGRCLHWENSGFSGLSPREAFLQFLSKVRRIIIEHPAIQKSWHSFVEFQNWLNQFSARQ